MIQLEVIENKIELIDYSDNATLKELSDEVNFFRLTNDLKTRIVKDVENAVINLYLF